ncbi:MAG: glycogen debranching enzyme, partial [Dehalococcoidia bacterium]
ALQRDHPVFRRRNWYEGRPGRGKALGEVGWFQPSGAEMSDEDWNVGFAKSLGVFLNGERIAGTDQRGEPVRDDSFLFLFNSHHEPVVFKLPTKEWGAHWEKVLDTTSGFLPNSGDPYPHSAQITVEARCVVLLRRLV